MKEKGESPIEPLNDLEDLDNLWELTFDALPDLIAIIDTNFKIKKVNKSMAKFLGVEEEEMMGKNCFSLFHDAEGPPNFCPHSKLIQDGTSHVAEFHEDKFNKDLQVSVTPILDYDNHVIGSVHVVQDDTQRKKAELALKESEDKYHSIFENSMDAVLLTAPNGDILDVNHAARKLFGYTRGEMIKLGRSGIVDLDDVRLPKLLEEREHEGKAKGELTLIKKDGSKFRAEVSSSIFKDSDGNERTSMIIKDVSERLKAEYKLNERVKELKALYEISKTLSAHDKSLNDILNEIVNYIPAAWQYPEITCARIILDKKEYKTTPFQETEWKMSSELIVSNENRGTLEVYYLKKVPEEFDGPFLKEERDLINTIAIELMRFLMRNKAETLLKESEDNLNLILTSAAEAVYGLDTDGNCTFCNPAGIHILGYKNTEELLGKNMHNLIHHSHPDGTFYNVEECPIFQAFRTGDRVHVDDEVLWRKDGTSFPAEYWSYPQIKNGEIVGAVVTFLDITERLKIEEERDRLFNFSIDMLCIAGFDGYFKRLNPAWEQTLGWTIEELTSKPYLEFIHPDDRKSTIKAAEGLGKGEKVIRFDNRYLCKDGSYKWVSWNSYPMIEEELIFAVARDVTELKEIGEALKESEIKYRNIFENVQDVFYQIDRSGVITEISPSIERYSGYKPGELIGKPVEMIYLDMEDRKELLKVLREKGELADYELKLETKNKDLVYVSVNAHFLFDSQNQPIGFEGSLRDISARKKAELKLQKSLEEKEMLLKEIHHRVKNNLMVISSLLNLQSQYIKDKEALGIFRESQSRAKSMALIHERLYRSTDLKRIDFGDYIRTLAMDLSRTYGTDPGLIKMNINVENLMLDINTAIPLGLIVNELLSNTMKHAFPNNMEGEINLDFRRIGNEYVLIVLDDGVGFPEDLDFKNTDSLGLQLVNSLTGQIGGEVELDTNKGTKFSIRFKEKKYG